jgi:S1-C subfamily serine protease
MNNRYVLIDTRIKHGLNTMKQRELKENTERVMKNMNRNRVQWLRLAACSMVLLASSVLAQSGDQGKPNFDISGAQETVVDGRRQLASYEEDSYGPLPYPETVARFVDDEIALLLSRQKEDGSFEFLNGRKTEAGGTVGLVTQAALCGYSLREHVELDPEAIEKAIAKTLDYVVYMVRSGKLRNGRDSTWWYAYTLRFLVHEYPHLTDKKNKALVEDACVFLLYELRDDLQQGTFGQKSKLVSWRMHTSPGMVVDDHEKTGHSVVKLCPEGSPAFKAGIRAGDLLLSANGSQIQTRMRFHIEQMAWRGGDAISLKISRGGETELIKMEVPQQYPGTLGFTYRSGEQGEVLVAGLVAQGNPTGGAISIGDKVLKIEGKEISKLDDVGHVSLFAGQKVEVEIEQGGRPQLVTVECLPAPAAYLGAAIQGGRDQGTLDGLSIQKMTRSSCLKKAGIGFGDRILRINRARVMNRRNFLELERTLWAGQKISVTYLDESGKNEKSVEVITGERPYRESSKAYHGIALDNRRGGSGAIIKTVAASSPADTAGLQTGDKIQKLNGVAVADYRSAQGALNALIAGQKLTLDISRKDKALSVQVAVHRPTVSPWISGSIEKSGGWAYYTHVRGGTTFLTSDILRDLIHARNNLPFPILDELISGPFTMLSKLRMKQPNSEVESYRYDAGGSFWGVKDIRGDIGRISAAELSCLMYCDTGLEHDPGMARTQEQLAQALKEWIRYRGMLDYAKTGGHQKFSIAPWYWPYSYLSTLQAAQYLTIDDALKLRLQKIALKAYFQYTEYTFEKDMGKDGWHIGYYPKKELLRVCLLLDGLATIKHLYRPRITAEHPSLKEAMAMFKANQYGKAHSLLQSLGAGTGADLQAQIDRLRMAIDDRFTSRLDEIKAIQKKFPRNALDYLKAMKPDFDGYSKSDELAKLITEWEKNLSN